MPVTVFVVDAFSAVPFKGNPAAVCLTADPLSDEQMQLIAAEINLSETAFLVPLADGFSLRWFTPKAEVTLCGHATLASAHTLWETRTLPADQPARFHTKSGVLTATQAGGWIDMDFPAEPVAESERPPVLADALGAAPVFVGRNRFDLFVEVASEDAVAGLRPNLGLLEQVDARGVVVTAAAGGGFDFVSRCFYPRVGVPEDPVTGSAHAGLAPYWGAKLGRGELRARQASARGGVLRLRLRGDRVGIAGQAVTVMRSELFAA
jgi:PhzF family phenazine biosynthesis protein